MKTVLLMAILCLLLKPYTSQSQCVGDTTTPVAICIDITTFLNYSGLAIVQAADINNGSFDNCAITNLLINGVSFSTYTCADVGVNTATLTVVDSAGNLSTCVSNITVLDTIAPFASCANFTVNLNSNGIATVSAFSLDTFSMDNCGIVSYEINGQTSFTYTCADLGINTAILSVTDASGNQSNCASNISVIDITPPIVSCSSISVNLDSTGMATVLPSDIVNLSFDNCSIDSSMLINGQSSLVFNQSNIGLNTATLMAFDISGNSSSCLATITVNGSPISGGIRGKIYQDFNQNCIQEITDTDMTGRHVTINPGGIIATTASNGVYWIDSLAAGNYTATVDTSGNWSPTCPATQSFTVIDPDSLTIAPSFGLYSNNSCTEPMISIHAPTLRRGFSNQFIYVTACNQNYATDILDSAYVVVELDSLIIVDNSSVPYTALGNNRYHFYLGNMSPGDCHSFWLSCTISNSAVLWQSLCMEAILYPIDVCALDTIAAPYPSGQVSPCTLPWDNSSLQVEGACVNDSIRFVIYNTGSFGGGDMDCFAPVRLYIDGQYTLLDSIQLNGGDSIVFMFDGNAQTWRLEADQHPLHPGNSNPNATVENCGTGTWTPNLVNLLPLDDADPINDIYCGVVRNSYDPNQKTGFPLGVGTAHLLASNQAIEYLIDFQNMGNDTAFTVVIRDTLSSDLDILSVQSGASSHAYEFRMYGPRVLEWTFNNILLPDSTVNEPASHGFVKFKVNQTANLANGTILENSAAIYFDFNAPVITNTYFHTIGENLLVLGEEEIDSEFGQEVLAVRVYPNPTTSILNIDKGNNMSLDFRLTNYLGQALLVQTSGESISQLDLSKLPAGIYLLTITDGEKMTTRKIIKQ